MTTALAALYAAGAAAGPGRVGDDSYPLCFVVVAAVAAEIRGSGSSMGQIEGLRGRG